MTGTLMASPRIGGLHLRGLRAVLDLDGIRCELASKIAPSTARNINSLARRSASGPHAD
jgi:hypothetical protein